MDRERTPRFLVHGRPSDQTPTYLPEDTNAAILV